MRKNRYSRRTEAAYVDWIKHYSRFHGIRHPRETDAKEVKAFLSHLAIQMNVRLTIAGGQGKGAGGCSAVNERKPATIPIPIARSKP
jgi:hypothetical protein